MHVSEINKEQLFETKSSLPGGKPHVLTQMVPILDLAKGSQEIDIWKDTSLHEMLKSYFT